MFLYVPLANALIERHWYDFFVNFRDESKI